jgi:hypothetical protein
LRETKQLPETPKWGLAMIDAPIPIIPAHAEQRQFNHPHVWMFLALAITEVVSLAMVTLPLVSTMVFTIVAPDIVGFVWLILIELLLVSCLAPALPGRSAFSASSVFLGFTILNVLIFSFVLTYAGRSIGETYLSTFYDGLAGGGWLWPHIGYRFTDRHSLQPCCVPVNDRCHDRNGGAGAIASPRTGNCCANRFELERYRRSPE